MDKQDLKVFLIKLSSILIAIIILINVTYNLVLADKMNAINSLLSLNIKENRIQLKEKVRLLESESVAVAVAIAV